MLTADNLATIQSALDTLAAIPSARLATTSAATVPLLDLHIKCYYCAPREYTEIGARKITRKVCSSQYEAVCDIDSLDVSATGATRAAALRNLFKAIRNAASLNAPTLRVPLVLCEPTKAKAKARAEREAERAADPKPWKVVQNDSIENIETVVSRHASERAAMRSVRAEISRQNLHNRKYARFLNYSIRADAPTIIGPAPELRAVDSHDDSLQVQVGGYSLIVCNNLASRFDEAPIIPADAEAGTEVIFKALLGLTTEQKIVALANALLAAQTTIYRAEEDGHLIIRAILPNYHPHFGTCTVLNL
jgi:hypothetical protein